MAAARCLVSSIEVSTDTSIHAHGHSVGERSLSDANEAHSLPPSTGYDVASKLEPLARLSTLVISTLQKIEISENHTIQDASSVTLAVFSLFQHLIEHIVSLARHSGALNNPSIVMPKTTAFRHVNGRFATRNKQDLPTQLPGSALSSTMFREREPGNPNILALANLFIFMLSNVITLQDRPHTGLDWSQITESLFNLLITRVSSLLSLMVFGASAPAQPFAAPVQLPLLKGSDEKGRAQEQEAIWLLYLLKGSLPLMTSQPMPSAGTDHAHQPSSTAHRKSAMGTVKKRLQNTLLRVLFGSSASDFEDALKMKVDLDVPLDLLFSPVAAQNDNGITNEKESVSDWFKSEVWRVVGWKLLRDWD